MKRTTRVLIGLSLILAEAGASAGPFDSWGCRAQVTFSGYARSETLTNVPMLVVLGPASIAGFDYGQFLSGSNADLRFTDGSGTTELNYEIEKWDATGSSYVWVQVPQLSGASTAVRAYWGMAGQSTPAYTTSGATWTNGYVGVWHMNAATCPESTTNHWSATASNVTLTNGQAGSALAFNGTSSSVLLTNVFGAAGGRFTAEILARTTNNANASDLRILDSWAPGCRLVFRWNVGSIGKCDYYTQNAGFPSAGAGAALTNSNWQYVAYVLDQPTNTGRVYQAGTQVGSGLFLTTNFGASASATNYLGRSTTSAANWFPGSMDEFRISSVLRSTNWLWACWMNMASNNAFDVSTALALTPVVVSQPASGIWDTWAGMNASLTSTGLSTTTVILYWGTSDGGTDAAAWANTNSFGLVSGPCPVALSTNITGLTASTSYTYRYFATNADGSVSWSAPQTFSTLSTVTAPTVNNSAGALITPSFTATLRGQVNAGSPVPAVYVCWGTANAGATDTGAWQHVDSVGMTSGSFGDAISGLTSNTTYFYACFATNAMGAGWSAVASFVDGTNTTWTGGAGGTGTNWNSGANWSNGSVPGPNDTVVFTAAGLTNNKAITLGASQTVYGVTIATTNSFTIGGGGDFVGITNLLTLSSVARQDVPGTENNQTIIVPVLLPISTVWPISGSNALVFTKNIIGSGGFEKRGNAELQLSGTGNSGTGTYNAYTNDSLLTEGTIGLSNARFGNGNVIVGGGTNQAAVRLRYAATYQWSMFGNAGRLTVKTNGLFDLSGSYAQQGQPAGGTFVEGGGIIDLGSLAMNTNRMFGVLTMKGGIVSGAPDRGGWVPNSADINVDAASTTTSVISCAFQTRMYYSSGNVQTQFKVNDGSAPIDLKMSGVIVNMSNAQDGLDKAGSGVMQLTGASLYGGDLSANNSGRTTVRAGTLLVDNTTGSGVGKAALFVNGGATLGGLGFIGGVSATYSNANVNLTGSATNNLATLAPGSIDTTSGNHLIGALTVGGAGQTNNVAFGQYSRLLVRLGTTPANCDCLVVKGGINLGSITATNVLEIATSATAPRGGDYTIATFNVLTGRFMTVRLAAGAILPKYTVNYLGTPTGNGNELANGSIVVTIPGGGTALFVR